MDFFLSFAEGQMQQLLRIPGMIFSGFPFSGTGFWRTEPIKIRSSLVILQLAKQ